MRGQLAASHSSRVASDHRVSRPIRMGFGALPASTILAQWRLEHLYLSPQSVASRNGGRSNGEVGALACTGHPLFLRSLSQGGLDLGHIEKDRAVACS